MSASLVGNGIASFLLRTNVSRVGPELSPASTGFQRVAGAICGSSAIFRGPTRRSRSGAIDCRQLAAAISRSAALIVTCASFSASANVRRDTAGPDTGAVPKVGGGPGGGAETVAPCGSPRHATAAPSTPSGAVIRNCLRVFMSQPEDVDQQTASGPARRGRTLPHAATCHIPALVAACRNRGQFRLAFKSAFRPGADICLHDLVHIFLARFACLGVVGPAVGAVVRHYANTQDRDPDDVGDLRGGSGFHFLHRSAVLIAEPLYAL